MDNISLQEFLNLLYSATTTNELLDIVSRFAAAHRPDLLDREEPIRALFKSATSWKWDDAADFFHLRHKPGKLDEIPVPGFPVTNDILDKIVDRWQECEVVYGAPTSGKERKREKFIDCIVNVLARMFAGTVEIWCAETLQSQTHAPETHGRSEYIFKFNERVITSCIEAKQRDDIMALVQLMLYLYVAYGTNQCHNLESSPIRGFISFGYMWRLVSYYGPSRPDQISSSAVIVLPDKSASPSFRPLLKKVVSLVYYVLVEGFYLASQRYVVKYEQLLEEWKALNDVGKDHSQEITLCERALAEAKERAMKMEDAWRAYDAIKTVYQPETLGAAHVNAEWPSEAEIEHAQDLFAACVLLPHIRSPPMPRKFKRTKV